MASVTPRAAALLNYPRPEITSPNKNASVRINETVVFKSITRTTPSHFNVQIDTKSDFSTAINYRSDRGGFEYYNGSSWVSVPYTGLPAAFSGNNIRLLSTLPSDGRLYVRIRQSPEWVTGGVLTSDATYYYRTFRSTGTFTVNYGTLPCDVLVIAGGGGGGWDAAGGGGAGGIIYGSYLVRGPISVVVGYGGTGSIANSSPGQNGGDSFFGEVRAFGGGGGANYVAGVAGGSGGGTGWASGSGGASTQTSNNGGTGYGNAGASSAGSSLYKGGGGGGAGAAGAAASTTAGAGGAGKNTWSSWATATGTGVSGYYAGGGGGGYVPGTGGPGSGGAGGGGTGGNYQTTNAAHGVPNTGSGGGGGGGGTRSFGGGGGSGLVIVRYLRSDVGG